MSRQSRKKPQRNAHITLSKIELAEAYWPFFSCSCCQCCTAVKNKCALADVGGRVNIQISGWTSICGNRCATFRKCELNPAYSPLSRQVTAILRPESPKTEQNRNSNLTMSPNFSLTHRRGLAWRMPKCTIRRKNRKRGRCSSDRLSLMPILRGPAMPPAKWASVSS